MGKHDGWGSNRDYLMLQDLFQPPNKVLNDALEGLSKNAAGTPKALAQGGSMTVAFTPLSSLVFTQ
eukprot:1586442-Prorocentrum_lima.AAC.1